jgi:hypothetical protein
MTHEAQKIGLEAEERVADLARRLGSKITQTPRLDYGGKTDLVIDGLPIQVSVWPKSRGEQERLKRRGIRPVAAGDRYSETDILDQLAGY